MNKICKQCNNDFQKPLCLSKKEWVNRIYCSKGCYTKSMKGKDILLNNRFSGIVWNKGKKGLSGDKNCNWKGGEVTLICKECSGYYKVKKYRENKSNFCSIICRQRNSNHGKTPENKRIRESLAYKAWRTLVFERDNYTCQDCGVRGGFLHADHIKPFAYFPDLRLEVTNGRTLCVPCHRKTPTYGVGAWRKLIASAQEV